MEWDVSDYTTSNHDTSHLAIEGQSTGPTTRHGLVGLCWHWRAPLDEPSFYTSETHFDIARAVTPGTQEYAGVLHDLDAIAGELEVLRDARVPVVWRPLHEANGRWFWWGSGGPEPFKKLWRIDV